MSNEKLTMSNEKTKAYDRKTCCDCLHCKVSVKTTKNCTLCFCAETENKELHKEPYWQKKPLCKKFEDMGG